MTALTIPDLDEGKVMMDFNKKFTTSASPTEMDPLGRSRMTLQGLEDYATGQTDSAVAAFNEGAAALMDGLNAVAAITETGVNRTAAAAAASLASDKAVAADSARIAAEVARDQAQGASVSSAVALAAKDTIALGRASVADGATFWVKPNATDGLARYTNYLRTSSTTQSFVGDLNTGTELDARLAKMPQNSVVLDVNLYNPNKAVAGGSLNVATGADVVSGGTWRRSEFMPALPGTTYVFGAGDPPVSATGIQYACYDANRAFIAASGGTGSSVTTPAGTAFLKIASNSTTTTRSVCAMALPAAFVPYQYVWALGDATYPLVFRTTDISSAVLGAIAEITTVIARTTDSVAAKQATFLKQRKNVLNLDPSGLIADTSINAGTGAPQTIAGHTATGFIPVTPGTTIYKTNGAAAVATGFNHAFYTAANVFISGSAASSVVVPANAAFMRMSWGSAGTTYMAWMDVAGAPPSSFSSYGFDLVTSSAAEPIFIAAASIASALAATGRVFTAAQMDWAQPSLNLFDYTKLLIDKAIQSSTGVEQSIAGWWATPDIAVAGGAVYSFWRQDLAAVVPPLPSIIATSAVGAWYTAGGAYISAFTVDPAVAGRYAAPANAARLRISGNNQATQTFMLMLGTAQPTTMVKSAHTVNPAKVLLGAEMLAASMPHAGERLCQLGDSFTQMNLYARKLLEVTGMRATMNLGQGGQVLRTRADLLYAGIAKTPTVTAPGSLYTSAPAVAFSGGGGGSAVLPTAHAVLGSGADADKVVAIVLDTTGHDMTAVPTVTLTGGGGSGATATVVLGTSLDDIEDVSCLAGTNDFGHGSAVMGTIADTPATDSIYGGTKYVIERILTIKPTVRIYFFTPINRGLYALEPTVPDGTVPNANGLTIQKIGQAIMETCRLYGVPCYDLGGRCGINKLNFDSFLSDKLHVNQTGADILGTLMGRFINQN